jgi:hypothetical protein
MSLVRTLRWTLMRLVVMTGQLDDCEQVGSRQGKVMA